MYLPGEPTRKIDQSDSFLPSQVLAYKIVFYFIAGHINENENVMKYGNKLETSCPKFSTIFYRIEAEL